MEIYKEQIKTLTAKLKQAEEIRPEVTERDERCERWSVVCCLLSLVRYTHVFRLALSASPPKTVDQFLF